MYTFLKGTVDITANTDQWATDTPFILAFTSNNHGGWGITKAISEEGVRAITPALAEDFYFTALSFLGINAFE